MNLYLYQRQCPTAAAAAVVAEAEGEVAVGGLGEVLEGGVGLSSIAAVPPQLTHYRARVLL